MSLKLRIILVIDWFDDRILGHRLHRFGLCDWIASHPWWVESDPPDDDVI